VEPGTAEGEKTLKSRSGALLRGNDLKCPDESEVKDQGTKSETKKKTVKSKKKNSPALTSGPRQGETSGLRDQILP